MACLIFRGNLFLYDVKNGLTSVKRDCFEQMRTNFILITFLCGLDKSYIRCRVGQIFFIFTIIIDIQSCLKISNSAYGQLISARDKLYTYRSDELEKFNDGGIHKVVTLPISKESFDNGLKKFVCCDVSVVQFIFYTNNTAQELQRSYREKVKDIINTNISELCFEGLPLGFTITMMANPI